MHDATTLRSPLERFRRPDLEGYAQGALKRRGNAQVVTSWTSRPKGET